MTRQERSPRSAMGQAPDNLPLGEGVPTLLSAADPTDLEVIAVEFREVRAPVTAQQLVEASLSAAELLLTDPSIIHNNAAYAIAVRLAQRLEEYLVVSGSRMPSPFTDALMTDSGASLAHVLRVDFCIEINQLVRELTRALAVGEAVLQGAATLSFEQLTQMLRVGNAEHRPEEVATAMQMPTETIFARFPELLTEDMSLQRRIVLQDPFALQYGTYWQERRRATAIVRGIENLPEDDLPPLSELIADRGEHAALLLTEDQESLGGDEHENVREAITVLVDFLDQASADIRSMSADDQKSLAKRLVRLNMLQERPENVIALLNACEVVKQHNPELFFRILGITTSLVDGTATESDVFGNPLMIALDQTNRDLATRKAVSPGVAVLRDRIDTLLLVDARRSPLPYLNDQQLRAIDSALQESLQSTDGVGAPNIFTLTLLLKYTPALELGKLMREVGFERRGEYVDRIRNGMPHEILADLLDMPEELLADPEVIAAWRERYDLDHPDVLHRYAMKTVFDFEAFPREVLSRQQSFIRHFQSQRKLGFVGSSDISDDSVISGLRKRKQYLEWAQGVIEGNAGIGERLWRSTFGHQPSQYDWVTRILKAPNPSQSSHLIYEINMQFFVFGLWAHAPKESYAKPGAMNQMIRDFIQADNIIPSHNGLSVEWMDTLVEQPPVRSLLLSLFPQEDWMSDSDWHATYVRIISDEERRDFHPARYVHSVGRPSAGIDHERKIRLRESVVDAIANDPCIRPGRLFADLFSVTGCTARSMLEIVRLQYLPNKDSISYASFVEQLLNANYSYQGHAKSMYLSRFAQGNFEFIEDVTLLTPIERVLHDMISPVIVQRLEREIQAEIQRQVDIYLTQSYESLELRRTPTPEEALLMNCIAHIKPPVYQKHFIQYINKVIESVRPTTVGTHSHEESTRLLKIRQYLAKLLLEDK